MLKRICWKFLLITSPGWINAQELLTLTRAIEEAINKNLNIELARLDQNMAEMQVYKSNAGFGPIVNLQSNVGATANRVTQNFLDGRVVDRYGRGFSPNISVGLDWVLYDGGRMQAVLERLGQLSQASSIQTQLSIQNLVTEVIQAYYEVMRLRARVSFLNTVIRYYEDRLRITEERWNVGKGSKIDFLLSKTDLNAQISQRSLAENDFKNGKIRLNRLLNRDLQIDYAVEEEVIFNPQYNLQDLIRIANEKNRDLLMIRKMQDISIITEKEIDAGRKPQVGFSSSLGYFYTNSNANFILSNQNAQLNVGFNARLTLFDGRHLRNQLAISQVATRQWEKQEEELLVRLQSDLTEAFNQYISDKQLLDLELQNQVLVEENLAISLEKFRLGGSSILEVNEAQRSYDAALDRLVNAQHNIRLSELRLLQLSGQLGS